MISQILLHDCCIDFDLIFLVTSRIKRLSARIIVIAYFIQLLDSSRLNDIIFILMIKHGSTYYNTFFNESL